MAYMAYCYKEKLNSVEDYGLSVLHNVRHNVVMWYDFPLICLRSTH